VTHLQNSPETVLTKELECAEFPVDGQS